MDEFVQTFHVDWKLLIAQLVNFGIVLFVIWRFALKPLMGIMAKRSEEIEKSLSDAKRIERELAETEQIKDDRLLEAKKEAQQIIALASAEAEKIRTTKIEQTKQEIQKVVDQTKVQIAAEKVAMLREAKQELGNLVISATEKVLAKKITSAEDKALVEHAVTSLKDHA